MGAGTRSASRGRSMSDFRGARVIRAATRGAGQCPAQAGAPSSARSFRPFSFSPLSRSSRRPCRPRPRRPWVPAALSRWPSSRIRGRPIRLVRFLARGRGYGLFLTPTETVLVLAPGDRRAVARAPTGTDRRRVGGAVGRADAPRRGRSRARGSPASSPSPGRSHYLSASAQSAGGGTCRRSRACATPTSTPGSASSSTATSGSSSTTSSSRRAPTPASSSWPSTAPMRLRLDAAGDLVLDDRGRRACGCGARSSTRTRTAGGSPSRADTCSTARRVRFRVAAWDALAPARHRPGPRLLHVPRRRLERRGLRHRRGRGRQRLRHRHDRSRPTSRVRVAAPGHAQAASFDVFVAKLNPAGTALVYSTYLGGSGDDVPATRIAVDAAGNAYVTG